MFVNIGLQNGVLLRTVLDPINGQLTDTRTRYGIHLTLEVVMMEMRFQLLGYTSNQVDSCSNPKESCNPCVVVEIMAELHSPKSHALYTPHLREPGLCMEFFSGT